MEWTFDDGGRAAAGFKGETSDCVCRAISIATGKPYKEVYDLINQYGQEEHLTKRRRKRSSARTGVQKKTTRKIMAELGWTWHPTMQIGQGCTTHMRAEELPRGTIICKLSGHVAAVINGVLHDTYDCTREETRCVYGYWTNEGCGA